MGPWGIFTKYFVPSHRVLILVLAVDFPLLTPRDGSSAHRKVLMCGLCDVWASDRDSYGAVSHEAFELQSSRKDSRHVAWSP